MRTSDGQPKGVTPGLDGPDATSPAIHPTLNSQGPACVSPDRPSNQSSHYSSSSHQFVACIIIVAAAIAAVSRCCSSTSVGRTNRRGTGIERGRGVA